MDAKMKMMKRVGAALLLATLAACGSGLGDTTATSTSGSGSTGGGGNNNTPPGIPNNIVFVTPASTNTVIALQGTGGTTNAEVTFQVDDASNTGVSGVPVTFALIPATGDASLTTATGTTDKDGKVSTFVVSGTQHYSVTVQATVSTPSGVKTANSNSLTISTGIPTQNNFAMSPATLTASNAATTLGVKDVITVLLSDRFNNPAPDGTAVAFTANTGQIPGQCITVGGSCNVTWVSSGDGVYNLEPHNPGRVEILAYTVGEESFTDVDGDGIFDNSDGFTVYSGSGPGDSFVEGLGDPAQNDIGEVYLDGDDSGVHQSGEFFHDFNNDKVRNGPDGHFYGFGCKGTPTVPCGSTTTKEIGKQICILLSTGAAKIVTASNPAGALSGTTLTVGSGVTVTFTVSDANTNPLAIGTTVNLIQGSISGFTVSTPTNIPYTYADEGCGHAGTSRQFVVTITPVVPAPVSPPPGGTIQLEVVTPDPGGAKTDSASITLTP